MNNEQIIASIKTMSPHELLRFILINPELLTDGYYSIFRTAILARATELGFY